MPVETPDSFFAGVREEVFLAGDHFPRDVSPVAFGPGFCFLTVLSPHCLNLPQRFRRQ
jgi:hypothetical protein